MKQRLRVVAVVVVLIGVLAGSGWFYSRLNPAAWGALVSRVEGKTATAAPLLSNGSTQLVASGNFEAKEVNVAAEMGGRIVEMRVDKGDEVTSGEMLVQLDPAVLLAQREQASAAVVQAQAALQAAQAQLDLTKAGARPEQIAAAEQVVSEALAGLAVAKGQLAAALANLSTAQAQVAAAKVSKANAEALVEASRADQESAQAQLSAAQAHNPAPEIASAQVGLERARIALDDTQDEYSKALDRPWEDQALRDAWADRLTQAQLDYRQAQSAVDAAMAGASVSRANVQLAQAGVHGAEARSAQAQAGVEAADVQGAQAQDSAAAAQAAVDIARAGVEAAQARLDQAQAALDLLRAGAREQEVALSEANVAQAAAMGSSAQAALQVLDAQLARLTLSAPVGGIVLERMVHAGELAPTGAPLLTIADLDQVTLTVYVPEANLGQVQLGQQVQVTVDAYPDTFVGVVSHIASQAEFTPKNVQTQEERVRMVFAVEIRLENADHRLKPGMPADAAFR